MKNSRFLPRFTPSLLDHETLEAVFVKRERLVEKLVDLARAGVLTKNKHHMLLVGPRGIGKTHLVSLVFHRVMKDSEIAERLVIGWLREEEWGLTSYSDLLLRLLRTIIESDSDTHAAEQYERLFELSLPEVESAAENLIRESVGDKTLLVIVENLDSVFHGLGQEGQEKLRAYLQNNPFVTILATSQSLFNGVSLRTSPFYGFFETHHLSDLSLEDVVLLLEKIARLEGNDELAALVHTPRGRARIRAVDHLAGGNPRIYVIFSQFLTSTNLDNLVAPLMQTLDDLTPYYQARMAFLSPQQRKIVEFLCDKRHAVIVREIAQRNFLTHQTASGQLRKLRELGYVRSHQIGRESYYELREPLMRLSLEVKKLRGGPVRLFVEFLKLWYSHSELEEQLESLRETDSKEREYITQALRAHDKEKPEPHVAACLKEYNKHRRNDRYEEALHIAEELTNLRKKPLDWMRCAACLKSLNRESEARVAESRAKDMGVTANDWRRYGYWLDVASKYEDALRAYDKAVELAPDAAGIWNDRGVCLGHLDRQDEELKCYQRATEIDPNYVLGWRNRALTLRRLNCYEEALSAADMALKLDPKHSYSWDLKGRVLCKLSRLDEAIATFEKAIELSPDNAESYVSKGFALMDAERFDEALLCLNEALRLNPQSAFVWMNKAGIMMILGRYSEALGALDKAERIDPKLIYILDLRAIILYRRGLPNESLACLDRILELDQRSVRAWANRAIVLSCLGRHKEALASFDRSVTLDPKYTPYQVHSNRSVTLLSLEREEEGIEELDNALRWLKDVGGVDRGSDISIVRNMLVRTRDEHAWRRFIELWIDAFGQYDLLSALGQGLVHSIMMLNIDWIKDETAKRWYEVWHALGAGYDELKLPLRLLHTAVQYKESADERILLQLPIEERKVLERQLGLKQTGDSQ